MGRYGERLFTLKGACRFGKLEIGEILDEKKLNFEQNQTKKNYHPA